MPKAPVTRINGAFQVQANTASNNSNNGLYAPQLTTVQIAAIPAGTLINGAIVYNTTLNTFQAYQNGAWTNFFATGITAVTGANYIVLNTDVIIGVTVGGAPRTITLPTAATAIVGKIFTIKDVAGTATANNITVAGNGANIDGAANAVINANYGVTRVFSNGTQWFTI